MNTSKSTVRKTVYKPDSAGPDPNSALIKESRKINKDYGPPSDQLLGMVSSAKPLIYSEVPGAGSYMPGKKPYASGAAAFDWSRKVFIGKPTSNPAAAGGGGATQLRSNPKYNFGETYQFMPLLYLAQQPYTPPLSQPIKTRVFDNQIAREIRYEMLKDNMRKNLQSIGTSNPLNNVGGQTIPTDINDEIASLQVTEDLDSRDLNIHSLDIRNHFASYKESNRGGRRPSRILTKS